jgi:hypothetical protein
MNTKRNILKLYLIIVLPLMLMACNKDDGDDGGGNSSATGTIAVYNKYPSSNAHNIYSIRIYNSDFDKWDFTQINRNGNKKISNIPTGTYTVQAEYVKGRYTKKSGVKVQKGKTTDVTFQ